MYAGIAVRVPPLPNRNIPSPRCPLARAFLMAGSFRFLVPGQYQVVTELNPPPFLQRRP